MVRRVDGDGSGEISYEEFTAEVESGLSGLNHLKRHMEAMFRAADKDGSGSLSVDELAEVMFQKATPAQRAELVAYATYVGPPPKELAARVKRAEDYSDETRAQLHDLFSIYDADGSGEISRDEMEAALLAVSELAGAAAGGSAIAQAAAKQKVKDQAAKMMASVDTSGDGEISFDEFVVLMGPSFEPDEE